jgi:hypothetical protein
MAIKFFFLPVVQNVAQLVADLKYGGASAEEINILAQQILAATPLTLPVNPETLEIATDSVTTTTEVVKLGEVIIPRGASLSKLTIESFFPYKEDNSIIALANTFANAVDNYLPSYVTSGLNLFAEFTPEKYYRYFKQLQKVGTPVRVVISECGVNMDMVVTSITKKYITCDKDMYYTLELSEYRDPKPTTGMIKLIADSVTAVATTVVQVVKPITERKKTGLAIGDTVIANGRYHYDSFGASPYGTFKDFRGKISHIASNPKATYKYHITTLDGGWRGWVKSDQIRGTE